MNQLFDNLFSGTTKPYIVANEKLEGSPIITPSLNQDGSPKTDNNGNALGTMRIEQEVMTMTGSFVNSRKRTAFITATLAVLSGIVKANNLKNGSTVPGKIIQVESLMPMWNGHIAKMNPSTAEEVSIEVNGTRYPVYMQQRYTEDMSAKDTLIRTAEDVIGWLNINQPAKAVVTEETLIPQG